MARDQDGQISAIGRNRNQVGIGRAGALDIVESVDQLTTELKIHVFKAIGWPGDGEAL